MASEANWSKLGQFHRTHRILPGDVMEAVVRRNSPTKRSRGSPQKARFFYVMKVEPSEGNGIGINAYEISSQIIPKPVFLNGQMRENGRTHQISRAKILARRREVGRAIDVVNEHLPVTAVAQIVFEYIVYLNPKSLKELDSRHS